MNRSDIKAPTEELVRISLWCSDHLSHDRMKVGVAMQFYMGDFEGDPLAGALSDAAKWRHLQAIEEARTSRPPGGIGVDVFKALTCDLPKKDRRILKVIWPKFENIRWNRGTLKSAVSALGTKLARGQNSRGAKPDESRDEALEMIRRTATTDRLLLPGKVESEWSVTAPVTDTVTDPLSQVPTALSQTILDLSQGVDRPPSSSPCSSPSADTDPEEEKNPPSPPGGKASAATASDDFDLFWEALPGRLKTGRKRAKEKWLKYPAAGREIDVVLAWLAVAKASEDWKTENARFAPRGPNIVNGQLWLDGTESFEAGNGSERQKGHREGGRFIPDLPEKPVAYGEPGYYLDKLRRSGERKSS